MRPLAHFRGLPGNLMIRPGKDWVGKTELRVQWRVALARASLGTGYHLVKMAY